MPIGWKKQDEQLFSYEMFVSLNAFYAEGVTDPKLKTNMFRETYLFW